MKNISNMKNTILSIMLLCTIGNITAQRSGFGIHAGVNATGIFDLENGYYDALDPLNGFQLGIRYNLKFGPIGICPELNFLNVKYNYPAEGVAISDGWNIGIAEAPSGQATLNYLSIPILFKVYIGGLNVHIGTQTSYLLGGSNNQNVPIQTVSEDITDDDYYATINGKKTWVMNDIDIAAVFGLGLDTKSGVYLSWRTIMSITPLRNLEYNDAEFFTNGDIVAYNTYYNNEDLLTRLISSQISIGFTF